MSLYCFIIQDCQNEPFSCVNYSYTSYVPLGMCQIRLSELGTVSKSAYNKLTDSRLIDIVEEVDVFFKSPLR